MGGRGDSWCAMPHISRGHGDLHNLLAFVFLALGSWRGHPCIRSHYNIGVESLVQGFNAGAVVKKEDIRGGHHLVTVPGAVFWPCLKHLQVRVAFMPIVCSNLLWDRIVATHILTILSHHQPAALLECKLVCSEPTAPATDGGMQ
jgi:hypothetical protein